MNTPSIKQMANRANGGHVQVLRAIRDGSVLDIRSDSEMRGIRICRITLGSWGCVQGDELTQRGMDLLAALETAQDAQRAKVCADPAGHHRQCRCKLFGSPMLP